MGGAPGIVTDVLNSPGQPLDTATRSYMESRFGQDFGDVRVHTDSTAARSAAAIDAHAYTVGRDIVFGKGRFTPGSHDGRQLIAHELTHVLQQKADSSANLGHRNHEDRGLSAQRSPIQLSRSNGKPPRFRITPNDMDVLRGKMLQLYDTISPSTRATLYSYRTVAIALVTDPDGFPTLVYTTAQNRTAGAAGNARGLSAAASSLGITSWDARGRTEGRGSVGSPQDAEQLLLYAADQNDFKVHGMVVSRRFCADCPHEIAAHGGGRISVLEVPDPNPPRPTWKPHGGAGSGGAPPTPSATSVPLMPSPRLRSTTISSADHAEMAEAITRAQGQVQRGVAFNQRLQIYLRGLHALMTATSYIEAIATGLTVLAHGTALPEEQRKVDDAFKQSQAALDETVRLGSGELQIINVLRSDLDHATLKSLGCAYGYLADTFREAEERNAELAGSLRSSASEYRSKAIELGIDALAATGRYETATSATEFLTADSMSKIANEMDNAANNYRDASRNFKYYRQVTERASEDALRRSLGFEPLGVDVPLNP
ncbi:hypothetical protein A5724_19215 [Mycobacterium sp. ACS1612]|nr:hypothetical protein A5724_19215 [Mycobacterium sp. ACS1612]